MSISKEHGFQEKLASLLAQEDLYIVVRDVETAFFDLKSRVITLPRFKQSLSDDGITLFIGHEIGHALFTPQAGWHRTVKNTTNIHSTLNIIEDARIERKVKDKYPGIRSAFFNGYQELLAKGLFGNLTEDLINKTFSLADKINVFYKVGFGFPNIKWTEEEAALRDAAARTTTFAEVAKLAIKVFLYDNKNKKPESAAQKALTDLLKDLSLDGEITDAEAERLLAGIEKQLILGGSATENMPETEKAFGKKASDLVDTSKQYTKQIWTEIPRFDDPREFILSYKQVLSGLLGNKLDQATDSVFADHDKNAGYLVAKKTYARFKKSGYDYVLSLCREFDRRKNAKQQARAQTSRLGQLDTNKLWKYRLDDDIFRAMTEVPKGKSHGMVFFIDWSGSMIGSIRSVIKQTLYLTDFCRIQGIPFSVYAFSSRSNGQVVERIKEMAAPYANHACEGVLYHNLTHLTLIEFLSSDMNQAQYEIMAGYLLNGRGQVQYQMISTPLYQTMILARSIIPWFQKKTKVQVMNAIFMSDGGGDTIWPEIRGQARGGCAGGIPVFHDSKTRKNYGFNSDYPGKKNNYSYYSQNLANMLRDTTKANILGIYIYSGKMHSWAPFWPETGDMESWERQKIEAKIEQEWVFSNKNLGYDNFFFIPMHRLGEIRHPNRANADASAQEQIEQEAENFFNGRASAKKHMLFLNQFIDTISD